MQIFRTHTDYMQKCFACGRVGHDMYRVTVKDKQYLVCSAEHASALENETNKKEELTDGPSGD